MLNALRVTVFRRLVGAYIASELAWGLGAAAVAVVVWDATGDPLATTVLFLATSFGPALVVPGLVAHTERATPSLVIGSLLAAQAACLGVLALLAAGDAPAAGVIALACAEAIMASAAKALSRASVVGALRPAGLLREGNALLGICFSAAFALGPAAGAVVIALGGLSASLTVAAVLAAAAALVVAVARLPRGDVEDPEQAWWGRLVAAVAYCRSQSLLGRLMASHAVTLAAIMLIIPVEVVYAQDTLHAAASFYGLMLACWGAGTVAGSVLFAKLLDRPAWQLLVGGVAVIGGAYAVIAAAPLAGVTLAACAVGGVGNGLQDVSARHAIQEACGEDAMARVMGLLEAVNTGVPGVAFLAGGVLAALTDPRVVYAAAAAASLLAACLAARVLSRVSSRVVV